MKKFLAMLLLAGLSLWGGVELGQNPPPALTELGARLGIDIAGVTAAPETPPAAEPADANAGLIPLAALNLLASDPPGTVYTLSVNEAMNQGSLEADIRKLTAALYESTILETVDAHANKWFVLTVGEYASREEAGNAGAVLYGSLGLSGVTKRLPPPAEVAAEVAP